MAILFRETYRSMYASNVCDTNDPTSTCKLIRSEMHPMTVFSPKVSIIHRPRNTSPAMRLARYVLVKNTMSALLTSFVNLKARISTQLDNSIAVAMVYEVTSVAIMAVQILRKQK
jgi:hypothetical protein